MAFTTDTKDRDIGLVWRDPDRADLPGTHVLIAGVGRFSAASGLAALASPPVTARRIADWFLPGGGFDNRARPLASLALLLSEAEDGTPSQVGDGPVPRARFAAMKAAMKALVARAEAHPDNQMIIYIASHGLGSGDRTGIQFEDYMEDPTERRLGMTDTDQMARALRRVGLDRKLVFLDCCRNEAQRFDVNEDLGLPVIDPPVNGTLTNPALILRSTLAGAQSYGETGGGVTVFGKALLAALQGLASIRNDDWEIRAANLSKITGQLMDLRKRDGKPIQIPQSDLAADFDVSVAAPTDTVALFLNVGPVVTVPDWVVQCDLADGTVVTSRPEWEGAGHARLDLPARREHRLRLTMSDGRLIAERTVDLDAPVAFRMIPDPNAPLALRTRSTDGGRLGFMLARPGNLVPDEAVGPEMPERSSPHEWLMPAMAAGVLQPGTVADNTAPGPPPELVTCRSGVPWVWQAARTRDKAGDRRST